MKRFAGRKFVIEAIFGAALAALVAISPTIFTASAATEGDSTVLQADRSLSRALGKPNKAAVSALLDSKFAWTDSEGKTRTKSETLQDLAAFSSDNASDTDVKSHFYGQLALIYGTHHGARFVRVWVMHPAGWRMFVDLDTPVSSEHRPATLPRSNGTTGDCDNPCRTLPYKAMTAMDKAVLAEWQKTKVDEWRPNAADWATHIADEFMIINNGSARNKPERVALAKKEQAAGIGTPGAPILSMNMYDFANAVVMVSHHVPYQGGKPYYNVRVFVNRDGHWPLVWSQQTTIQAARALPPVATSNK